MCRFKLNRTDATEMAVAMCRIVEAFDLLGYVQSGSLSVGLDH